MIALLPSPLLGPAVWEPVAALLAGAVVVDTRGSSVAEVLAAAVEGTPRGATLVAHSNAGLYVPAVAAARGVEAAVFVDAMLPPPGPGEAATTSAYDWLAERAGADGLLPVWSEWWGEDVSGLFGEAVRERALAEQRRVPLAYFRETVPVPAWGSLRCAYVAFGGTYADETATARERGWPVVVLPGEHLEMTRHPAAVAEVLAASTSEDLGAPRADGPRESG